MNKPKQKKAASSAYDFCPKHNVFFASCGCSWEKGKRPEKNEEIVPLEYNEGNKLPLED